ADHSLALVFLNELFSKLANSNIPVLVGGDFNLHRDPADKNNSNFNWHLAHYFNDCISSAALREIPRVGARFTWSNR
uniref:Endonuclease/exonuclease/phosphatase domain-containing protein n=1 Tax=Aegilops tauschii subsp. strangulata TaxID=200361 RepID=A0A453ID17_AEGTS